MLRAMIAAALLGVASSASAAEPIFVPDFTPGSSDQFAVAVMVQGMVADRLLADGHIVLTSEVVQTVVGQEMVVNCGTRPTCPFDVLPKIPTRVAVVVRVDRSGAALNGHVELYEQSNPNPLQTLDIPITPGKEAAFADEVAQATRDLLVKVGPSPDNVLMAAARLIAGQPPGAVPPEQPVPAPVPAPAPVAPTPAPAPTTPTPAPAPIQDLDSEAPAPAPTNNLPPGKKGDGSKPHEGPIEPILEDTGVERRHLVGAERQFMNSGLDPRDWVYRNSPHAGRLTIEIHGGIALGDVNRVIDMRVESVQGEQNNAWYQDTPSPSRQPRGAVYVGYAPAVMLDLGALVGVQYGKRRISTGIVEVDALGNAESRGTGERQPVDQLQFVIQPRARVYMVPTGPVKPFVFTGAQMRIFDRVQIDQPEDYTYAAPPGGVTPGWVGGGGMMIDPGPIVGLFAEGSYVRHFGPRAERGEFTNQGPWPYDPPPLPNSSGGTVAITGGVQFRL